MIRIAKIIYEKNGAYIARNDMAEVIPEFILRDSLCPFVVNSDDTRKFEIDGKVVEGLLIANNERIYESFAKTHQVKDDPIAEKRSSRTSGSKIVRRRRPPWASRGIDRFTMEGSNFKIVHDQTTGEKYLFMQDEIVIFSWKEENGSIFPIFAASADHQYYYYGATGESGKTVVRTARRVKDIPRSFMARLTSKSRFQVFGTCIYYGYYHPRGTRKERIDIPGIGYADFLPFPPYEILGALRLIPPKTVEKAKPAELPGLPDRPCFLKTFLLAPSGVPIIKAQAGTLRSLAACTQKNLYMPGVKTEDPSHEYENLYHNSAGYLLLCRPKWPIKG